MATLLLNWAIDEGTGSTLTESVNGRDAFFGSAGGYPSWTTGPDGDAGEALTFSGSSDSGAYAATDESIICYPGLPTSFTGITMVVRFRLEGTATCQLLGAYYDHPLTWTPTEGVPFDPYIDYRPLFGVFVNTQNRLAATWEAERSGSGRTMTFAATPTVNDGSWHVAIIRVINPNSCKINLDGTGYSTTGALNQVCATVFPPTGFLSANFYDNYWAIGGGEIYANGSGPCYSTASTSRSFYGDIDLARVYCGLLTDEEVDDLYNEIVNPPQPANAIMFSCNT